MQFFRSPLLRRIIYAVVIALALTRFATRSHSEPLLADDRLPPAAIQQHVLD
jgi:hypothetical protein